MSVHELETRDAVGEKQVGYSIRPGCKQTAVGLIPKDWKVVDLDSVAFVTSGKRLPAGYTLTERKTPHPYLRVIDMRSGSVSLNDIRYVPENAAAKISRYRVFSSDIFISVAGTLGIVGIVPQELDGANLTENADRITQISCNQRFLLYVLLSPLIQNVITSIQTIGAQPKLALSRIRKFQVPLPPTIAEQEAIAEALGDADALVESLERLLAKKRNLKQAAMQQLLTGKKRLPGFESVAKLTETEVGLIPSDWDCVRVDSILADIAMGPFGSNIKVSNFVSSGVPVLNGASVNGERLVDSFHNFVTSRKAKSLGRAVARKGDIVITHRGTLGQIAFIPNDSEYENYVISQSQFRVRFNSKRAIPSWIVSFYHSERGASSLLEKKGHTGVPAIAQPTTTFRGLFVPLPSVEEQTAIATVLSDMDAEIAAIEARIDKACQIKAGMMQELLIGKTRLM